MFCHREHKGYICDIVKDLMAFLVVYQSYVNNIKKSIKLIDTYRNTHPVFAALLDEIEVSGWAISLSCARRNCI